ncbi:MAG: glycosyltransferase family 4 protein [bacterium]|nr:glycosyltransferase family 4 protein [bacterium]
MRALMMCRLCRPHVGGVEKHVAEICRSLSHKGYEITIICEKHDEKLPDHEEKDGMELYRIPLPSRVGEKSKKWLIWKWWLHHSSLLRQADVIHIHDVFYWFLPFRLPFWNKKVYMTFHGYEGNDSPTLKQIFWHRIAAGLTQGNICIGDFHKKWYGVKPDDVSYGAV